MKQAKEFDFITLPENIRGTHCLNCSFACPKGNGHVCGHEDLKGLPITDRNCCSLWTSSGVLRAWEEKGKHPWHDDSNYRSIEGSDLDKRENLSEGEKALSWLASGMGGDLVAPAKWMGPNPKKRDDN